MWLHAPIAAPPRRASCSQAIDRDLDDPRDRTGFRFSRLGDEFILSPPQILAKSALVVVQVRGVEAAGLMGLVPISYVDWSGVRQKCSRPRLPECHGPSIEPMAPSEMR